MDTLDSLLRGLAVGVQLVAALLALRMGLPVRARLRVVFFCASIAGYTLVSSRYIHPPAPVEFILLTLAIAAPVAIGWFAAGLFLDRPAPHPGILLAVLALLFLAWALNDIVWVATAHHLLVGAIYVATLWLALSTAGGDLVEPRRRFRVGFVGAVALVGLMVTGAELFLDHGRIGPTLLLAEVIAIAALSLTFTLWLAGAGSEALAPSPAAAPEPAEPHIAARAEAAMRDGLWRKEGLTIGDVAATLGVPEHRLRHAINRDLGYRNFPSFVNAWRIRAAREALGDPARRSDTVLQIAYEVGFSSLGPFNRAFRDVTGMTPTEFRRKRTLADS